MADVKELSELMTAREGVIAKAEETIAAAEGGQLNDEQTEALRGLKTELADLDTQLAGAHEAASLNEHFAAARSSQDAIREEARPAMFGGPAAVGRSVEQFLTPGETYVGADSYSDWMARFPNGAPSSGAYQGEGVDVKSSFRTLLGMSTPTEQRRAQIARTLVTSGPHGVVTPSAGDLVRPDWRGLLETGLLRPLTVRQLITTIPTESDAIEYAREVSRVHAAATVAEAAASTGATGLKPEGGLEFALVSDTVKTIAAWVAATKRIIADATGLAAYINQYLSDDIALELEDQITSGNGVGEDFVGILNTPGIQTQGVPAGTETILDIFRFAKRKIRVNARTNATAALVNPEDLEIIDTLKAVTSGNYLGNDPFAWSPNPTLWGIPLIESEAVAPKTALMGDFKRAILFDRESTNISVGTANDDFLRNIVRVLAEMRAGFGVVRPAAFVEITVRP